ncbi:serine/threonine-protein kinase [Actinomadura macrotermitis]|uniref:Serine/threonine-protein kinase PknD n=1 Tax=Actinomadura macrotermitis TaxID=2585200 RepID=A0A7K0C6H0_9ACTN|nr:serine/threonine-protein kinase [Actinomadura macrotermitis]MQY09059.1 Serine/threonine-protein kinase PknD [Actinomadura macrotermitis]
MRRRESLMGALVPGDPGVLGPFVLLGRLGAGSMGRVYLGRSAAGRLVAVKTIHAELARDAGFRVRFGHEAAAARRVSGAYTAPVVAAAPDADPPWLATAYVPAPSLERLVEVAGPLPVAAVRWLAAGCAEALESVHAAGLVHRDLKPSNVLVALDGPRVIDFGLAHACERARVTVSRVAVGTPAYMAPEQAAGAREVTPASDVYALGSALLYAATGHGPYAGEGVLELMAQLATRPPDLAGLPPALDALVRACLERDPRDRPRPAELVAAVSPALDRGAGGDPGRAYLPAVALELVQEYRDGPRLELGAEPVAAEPMGEEEPPPPQAPPVPAPASTAPRTASSSVGVFLREPRNRLASVLAVALVGIGVLIGRAFWPGGGTEPQARPARQGPPAPPGPVSGAHDRPGGPPEITVNQPYGDARTVFVVHGTGWPPGERVALRLDASRARPGPWADRAGTFNYGVNQGGEFHPGGLPPGRHRISALVPGGGRPPVTASFRVDP